MARRLDVASGENFIEQPFGSFEVQIQHDDRGSIQAKVVARLLAPPRLSERQRSSGLPSTVEVSIPLDQLFQLAVEISAAVELAKLPLPKGVLVRA
jgi:hypothetical protein